jgi:4-hydroxybenzoate polyprenyltransferase
MMDKHTLAKTGHDHSVLVVDLDHTLIATDTLLESVLLYLKSYPHRFFLLLGWLLRGKSYFKDQLAQRVCPEPATLPYRREVLEYIGKARDSGTPVILATASHHRIADGVAAHLGLFSAVLASDAETNLSGRRKLNAVLARTGKRPFAYVGDAAVDIPLWEAADTAVLIEPTSRILRRLKGHPRLNILLSKHRPGRLRTWIKALRIHQWAKNLLVFLPAIMAHRVAEPAIVLHLLLAFLSLSLMASSVYLLNDLLDLEDDRQHLKKKYRPLAAGTFSIRTALCLMPIFLISSYTIALLLLPLPFSFSLIIYLLLTSLYSFILKQKIIIDIILLATLYTFRVIVGALAVNILVSSWLLAFSMFFFLSLALMKRYSELLMMHESLEQIPGRGYMRSDCETTMASGIASGQLSLLVFALFMNSRHMQELYGKPELLWLVLPVLFYWITRMWMIAHRGEMIEDPIVFTIKDPTSYVALGIIILLLLAASQQVGTLFPVRFLEP